MRKAISLLVMATALAGCALIPFGDEEDDAPGVAAAPTPAPVAVAAHTYEIKDADRGPVRRVKVLLDGRTVATLVMSKARNSSSSYCCTADGCEQVDHAAACSAFKMTCDKDGACVRANDGRDRL